MSTVRQCDRCTSIFSERAEGWSTFAGTTVKRDRETGQQMRISETLDLCPDCTELQTAPQPANVRTQLPPGQVTSTKGLPDDS